MSVRINLPQDGVTWIGTIRPDVTMGGWTSYQTRRGTSLLLGAKHAACEVSPNCSNYCMIAREKELTRISSCASTCPTRLSNGYSQALKCKELSDGRIKW
ncbi:hypothetical protein RRG08_059444 [Elysia crispata]|uniref:Uncharacterized protein n=1 Tax=Elysia crispata TaxID=231223 RepID=A0AAE1A428_9GAST|nr:hypothetical protein RRG08_059444 [Elysia crispata]